MLTLLWWSMGLAAEAPQPVVESPETTVLEAVLPDTGAQVATLLATARALSEDQQYVSARQLLQFMLSDVHYEAYEAQIREQLEATPEGAKGLVGRLRLGVWQAGLATAGMGPYWAQSRVHYTPGSVVLAMGVTGGAVGLGSALMVRRKTGLSRARAHTISAGQQLGLFHAMAINSSMNEAPSSAYWAVAVAGTLAGSIPGYAIDKLPFSDGAAVAAHSGAAWGTGLALATLQGTLVLESAEDDSMVLWPLLLGADLGLVTGFAIGHTLKLDPAVVQAADVGVASAVFFGLGMMTATQDTIAWTPDLMGYGIGGLGLIGGVTGGFIAHRGLLRQRRAGKTTMQFRPQLGKTKGLVAHVIF